MKIHCQERYTETLKYAESIGDRTLQDCIDRLKQWEENSAKRGVQMEIQLCSDFEKHSFGFYELYADERVGIQGGVLFHGTPNTPDDSMAVCVDGRAYGWRIHT